MKFICMIPARLASTRVPKKNLRLLNGVPLVSYAIRAAKEAQCFDEIYVNSEADIFKKLAEEEGVSFYKRPKHLSLDAVTNDIFAKDFIENNECDYLIQILPTSPFITPAEINEFVQTIKDTETRTLISVRENRIESIYDGTPINFDQKAITPPSQFVTPVLSYACGLMGWHAETYLKNMKQMGCAYHGGDSFKGFFILEGFSTVDIDTEEDFKLAEVIAESLAVNSKKTPPQYYDETHVEVDVPTILKKDGVLNNDLFDANNEIVHIEDIINSFGGDKSWSKRLVNTENNSATLIHQLPGQGNRRHFHPNWNEWWYIIEGEWKWEIDGVNKVVRKGDVVFIPKNIVHRISVHGDKPAIRLAVSREDVPHIYPR